MKRTRLSLRGIIVVAALAIVVSSPVALRAQVRASERRPTFEVASVKQNLSNDRRSFGAQPGGRLVVRNMAVKDLIAAAFGMAEIQALVPERILGGPGWIDSERYDIEAKASTEFQFAPGRPPQDMLLMLRSLLEDRFKLVAHRETREMPIFELVVASKDGRLGPGLHKTSIDCGRFVVDKTGLTERFDFNLAWTPDRLPTAAPPPGIPPVDPNGPPLVTALQEQLGLKVNAAKGPVDVLVIDRVEHPTPD